MRYRTIISVLLSLTVLTVLFSGCVMHPPTPEPPIDAHALNRRLGRGINLGNALEAPKEGDWGVTLKSHYFPTVREAGFESVRIPIRWSAHTAKTPPYTIDPEFLARVDWAVEQALSNDFVTIINVHHYEEMMKHPEQETPRLLAIWQQLAEHYRDAPGTVIFELLNEPSGKLTSDKWNALLAELIPVVRQSNPDRVLMIDTTGWGKIGGLQTLEIPPNAGPVIVSVHYYDPFHFTHQGASWIGGSQAWLPTAWEGTEEERAAIARDMQQAADWGRTRDIPMHIGEFGAFSAADMQARARWTDCVARAAEAQGMPWAYWEFCSGFGAYDPDKEAWRTPLLRALIP